MNRGRTVALLLVVSAALSCEPEMNRMTGDLAFEVSSATYTVGPSDPEIEIVSVFLSSEVDDLCATVPNGILADFPGHMVLVDLTRFDGAPVSAGDVYFPALSSSKMMGTVFYFENSGSAMVDARSGFIEVEDISPEQISVHFSVSYELFSDSLEGRFTVERCEHE